MTKGLNIGEEMITRKIYQLRGQRIMLDSDLAEMYGVTTGNLNKAVKRNIKRFPMDFMFQLNHEDVKILIFQNGRSSWGGRRKLPYGFTEQGVAMLSSVLNSERAIEVNIRIIRIFTKLREMLLSHKDILLKLEHLEKKIMNQDEKSKKHEDEIQIIFTTLRQLISPSHPPRKKIGFKSD